MPKSGNALHDHAIQMSKHAEALATGLGQLNAPDAAIEQVTQCANLGRDVAGALAKSDLTGEPRDHPDDSAPPDHPEEAPDAAAEDADKGARTDFAGAARGLSQDVQAKANPDQ